MRKKLLLCFMVIALALCTFIPSAFAGDPLPMGPHNLKDADPACNHDFYLTSIDYWEDYSKGYPVSGYTSRFDCSDCDGYFIYSGLTD